MQTIEEFCKKHNVRASLRPITNNPNMGDMPQGSKHFDVTLVHEEMDMHVMFSVGPGWDRDPAVEDVLDCLSSNASCWNATSFENWAEELGYDPDSRKAEKTFRLIVDQTHQLRDLLGEEAFQELLYETEKL